MTEFSELRGKTIVSFDIDDIQTFITIKCDDGSLYEMYHQQDCCEQVWLEDIAGDIQSVVGSPVLLAEKVSNNDLPSLPGSDESYTWTFYKIATMYDSVTLRWYGTSNGYYSEDVEFVCVRDGQETVTKRIDYVSAYPEELYVSRIATSGKKSGHIYRINAKRIKMLNKLMIPIPKFATRMDETPLIAVTYVRK